MSRPRVSELELLIRLSNPFIDDSEQFSEVRAELVDWDELVSLAVRNKVICNLHANLGISRVKKLIPERVAHEIEVFGARKHRQTDALLNEIPQINRILQKRMIDFIVIKTIKPFPSECSDIDILLPSLQHLILAAKAFEENGYHPDEEYPEPDKIKLHKTFTPTKGPSYKCVVDLHGKITQDSLDLISQRNVWIRKRYNTEFGVNVPSSEDDFLTIAIESFFGDNTIYLRNLFHLVSLARRGIDWNYIVQSAARYGWVSSILTVISGINSAEGFSKSDCSMFTEAKLRALKNCSTRLTAKLLSQNEIEYPMPTYYSIRTNLFSMLLKVFSDAYHNELAPLPYIRHLRRIMGIYLSKEPRLACTVQGYGSRKSC